MKKLTTLSGIAALMFVLSAASAATWAAPNDAAKPDAGVPDIPLQPRQPMPMAQFPHAGPGFPPPPPLYEATLQTRTPEEALNKLVANAPKGTDKNYEVRVMVRELPPAPPIEPEQTAHK
ncbi:hypothetical protein JHU04_003961 [Brenneria sp. 4F2]|nr:hypothetical protein [Brenneria bubanii]